MTDVFTLGETMVVLLPESRGYLRYVDRFSKGLAGAESNVAAGLAKLGFSARWMSRLGKDEFGAYILRELRAEGVDVSGVYLDETRPTGIMFKQVEGTGVSSVFYYRRHSAASVLHPADIQEEDITNTKMVHLTGVTSALGSSCAATNLSVAQRAKCAGVTVSFDPNIRLKLWSAEKARETLLPLLQLCDIALLGIDEGEMLLGQSDISGIIGALKDMGVGRIALKLGEKGAVVADETGRYTIPPLPVCAVDSIGAGDAFTAGFLAGVLEEADIETCGRMGAAMGGLAVTSHGDIDGLPDREQLRQVLHKENRVYR